MKDSSGKNFLHNLSPLALGIFHIGLLFAVYQLLVLGSFIHSFDIYHFLQWDAYWYAGIAKDGYHFSENQQSNTAFFPLFPFVWKVLWKISNAGVGQVCAFNTLMFLLGMTVLKKAFKFSWLYFLVFLSIPSNIFMYVPYTEALFFFFSTLVLAGFKTENKIMIMSGLFLASLTRPAATFFIPSILAIEILNYKDIKLFIKNSLMYIFPVVLALLVVFLIQYKDAGVWLAFFLTDGWSRDFKFPQFPLTTWGGLKKLWLDGLALFFGLMSAFILLLALIKKLKVRVSFTFDKAASFSLTYLTMALCTVLFFSGRDNDGGTTLLSLNRFVMASAYFTIFLFYLTHQINLDLKKYGLYFIISIISLLVLNLNGTGYNEYTLNQKIFYVFFMFCHIQFYVLISSKFRGKFLAALYLINVFIQLVLLSQFANSGWIG